MSFRSFFARPSVIILTVVIVGGGVLAYRSFSEKPPVFTTVKVVRKAIEEHVMATGSVAAPAKYSLSFERQGTVTLIPVKIGDEVKKGDPLVTLDSREAQNALARAKANEASAYAKLKQVTSGTRAEEIYLAETALRARQSELDRARSLADTNLSSSSSDLATTLSKAVSDLAYDYENGISTLRSNIGRLKQALVVVDRVRRLYFASRDTIDYGFKIQELQYLTEREVAVLTEKINAASDNASIDSAFAVAPSAVSKTLDLLRYIRNTAIEDPNIRDIFPTIERTNLETERTSIESVETAVTTAKQNIENQIAANRSNIVSAEQKKSEASVGGLSDVTRAQSAVDEAEAQLKLKRAAARSSDVNVALADLDAAKASVSDAEVGLAKTVLLAPVDGVVTELAVDIGEVIGASTSANPAVTMIAARPYEIEANVAEIDIPKLSLGNTVTINFDAFPGMTFDGQVKEIYPAETVIQGVIYYRIKAAFDDPAALVKPGMTANLLFVTASKSEALVVPYSAITREGRKDFVRLPKGSAYDTVEVQIGIQGDTELEITSGVAEGQDVITFIKTN